MAEKTQIEVETEQAEIVFAAGEREGLVAVGTYISEAANRFGIFHSEEDAEGLNGFHWKCTVTEGAEFLSAPTAQEIDNLSEEDRVQGERLAYQTRIESAGKIVVKMTETEKIKSEEELKRERFEAYQKEFGDLPLGQKVTSLMTLEAITLGETFSFILNLPFTIGDQVMGVMAGFGKEMDKASQAAHRPAEHNGKSAPDGAKNNLKVNNDKLQKITPGVIRNNATYIGILSLIAGILLIADFPAYLLVFFAVFSFFIWKAFAPTRHHEVRGIFEFYLASNELLRDDERRWFGFEMQEVLHSGEKILATMPDPPPLVLFTLGALYHKMGNYEGAAHHLTNVIDNPELDEKRRLIASPELKNYVRVLRKIERDPAEAPQTSAAIRALERARRNRAGILLDESRKHLQAANDDGTVLDLTANNVDADASGRWNQDTQTPPQGNGFSAPVNEADRNASPRNFSATLPLSPGKDDDRKSISEVLKDIYDR